MIDDELDRELVAQTRRGSQVAFGRLVDRHQQTVRSFLRRVCRDVHEADDIAQETFLTAWEWIAALKHDESVRAWLCGVAYRKALSHLRQRGRAMARETAWLADAAPTAGLTCEDRIGLADAMWSLPADQRAAIALCLAGGFSHGEAAAALALPLGTVKSYVERGRAKLLARLETGHG